MKLTTIISAFYLLCLLCIQPVHAVFQLVGRLLGLKVYQTARIFQVFQQMNQMCIRDSVNILWNL